MPAGLSHRDGTGGGDLSASTAVSLGQGVRWLSWVNLRHCQFDILPFIAFPFCELAVRVCVSGRVRVCVSGVKKLSPLFSGFRHTSVCVCVCVMEGGRLGQGWRQGQVCASCRYSTVRREGPIFSQHSFWSFCNGKKSITVSG